MATLMTLMERGDLDQIEIELSPGQMPEGFLAATPRCRDWLLNDLPMLETTVVGGRQTPSEQVDDILYRFVTGKALNIGVDFKHMHPHQDEVWELRTDDVRIFGWFAHEHAFVGVVADASDRVHEFGLHAPYLREVVRVRNELDLDNPKFVPADLVKMRWDWEEDDGQI